LGTDVVKRQWWNPFSWGGYSREEMRNGHLDAWEDKDFLQEYHRTLKEATV